jgi:hypothetical protein
MTSMSGSRSRVSRLTWRTTAESSTIITLILLAMIIGSFRWVCRRSR